MLEQQVHELRERLGSQLDPSQRKTDWRRAFGFFGNDPVIKRIFRAAEEYREEDRRKFRQQEKKRAQKKAAKSRRSKA